MHLDNAALLVVFWGDVWSAELLCLLLRVALEPAAAHRCVGTWTWWTHLTNVCAAATGFPRFIWLVGCGRCSGEVRGARLLRDEAEKRVAGRLAARAFHARILARAADASASPRTYVQVQLGRSSPTQEAPNWKRTEVRHFLQLLTRGAADARVRPPAQSVLL